MSYRIEHSTTSRAGCQNTACKKEQVKIQKGELRFGTWVEIPGYGASWRWKHWGCVTPLQISNVKKVLQNNLQQNRSDNDEDDDELEFDYDEDDHMNFFDEWNEIDDENKEKVREAFKVGHVGDDEWRGVPEWNRPGMKGINQRSPTKSVKSEGEPNNVAKAAETPAKPKAKRSRARKVKTEDEENIESETAEADEPAEAKPKPKKRGRKVKEELTDGEDVEAEYVPRPTKTRGRKVKTEPLDDDESHVPKPEPKHTKSRATKIKAEPVDDDEPMSTLEPEPEEKPKKTRKRKAADIVDEEEPASEPMAKRARKSSKIKTEVEKEDSSIAIQMDSPADIPALEANETEAKPKKPKNAAKVKQVKAKPDGDAIDAPVKKRTRKKNSKVKTEPAAEPEDAQDPAEEDPATGIKEEEAEPDADMMEIDIPEPVPAKKAPAKAKNIRTTNESDSTIKEEREISARPKRGRKAKA